MYYGIDSNTSAFPSNAPTHDFYIGKMGQGTSIFGTTGNSFWNTSGAAAATKKYMYWWLLGPQADPYYATAQAKGQALYGHRCSKLGRDSSGSSVQLSYNLF